MSKSKPELKLVEDTGSQLQDEDLSIELPPQQSEMPFAVVEGEPMTQLPRDLYIPPDALQVFLTAFEGPLDLLLYLIRKQNLDILNIPIAEITRQYMQYIEVMADLQLELAGEYLLMAAMLAEIKSRMLLPRPAAAEGQEEEDPRAELVRRLQEYERFKKAAEDIDRLARLERDTMPASAELEERKVVTRPPDVTLKEMLDAFRDVLSRAEKFAHHHISRERLSQRERMSEILSRLQTVAFFEFTQLFKVEEGRMGVTVTFIAILELMKEGLIEIVQAEAYAPIHVRTAQRHLKVVQGGAAAEEADAENVAALSQPELAGENDMPDEFDDEPVADEAAMAVQAAVADVAAASSIAVDSVESEAAAGDAGVVDAAVSEALASTESAVDTIATEEAAEIEASAVIEQPVVDEPAVGDDAADDESVAGEDASASDEFVALEGAGETVVSDPSDATVVEGAETVDYDSDQALGFEASDGTDASAADAAVEAAVVDEHVAAAHVVEEHMVEEHIVPEHVVEVEDSLAAAPLDAVVDAVPDDSAPSAFDEAQPTAADSGDFADDAGASDAVAIDESSDVAAVEETANAVDTDETNPVVATEEVADVIATDEADDVVAADEIADEGATDAAVGAIESQVVEEHVIEEHEVDEHVVPEHVIDEHEVPAPSAEESASLASFETEVDATAAPVDVSAEVDATAQFVDVSAEVDTAAESVEAFEVEGEAAEIADEPVASDDLPATGVVAEDAQPLEAVEAADHAQDTDANPVAAEEATALETIEVAAEDEQPLAAIEVAAEGAPQLETIEVAVEGAAAVEMTNVGVEEVSQSVATDSFEPNEPASEQPTQLDNEQSDELSVDDDTMTGSSSEADNSDAEPSR